MRDDRVYLAELNDSARVAEAEYYSEQIETNLKDELFLAIKRHIEIGEIDLLDWYLDERGVDLREFFTSILDTETDDDFSHIAVTVLIYRKTHNDAAVNDVASYLVGLMDFEQLLNAEIERLKINDSYNLEL